MNSLVTQSLILLATAVVTATEPWQAVLLSATTAALTATVHQTVHQIVHQIWLSVAAIAVVKKQAPAAAVTGRERLQVTKAVATPTVANRHPG